MFTFRKHHTYIGGNANISKQQIYYFLNWIHILTKCFLSDSHVDHDPLHDAADAKEDREESVYAEATFPRNKAQ